MPNILTKDELYQRVDVIRGELGLSEDEPIPNVRELLSQLPSLRIDAVPFVTEGLHSFCDYGEGGSVDVIVLNSNRSPRAHNFDCMHEYVHLHEHRGQNKNSFYSFERVVDKQDVFLEWQANEGAAEVLVPYRYFIPRFAEYLLWAEKGARIDVLGNLADYYKVTPQVIAFRVKSLAFEIDQYRCNIPVEEIKVVSAHKLQCYAYLPTDYLSICQRAKERPSLLW